MPSICAVRLLFQLLARSAELIKRRSPSASVIGSY